MLRTPAVAPIFSLHDAPNGRSFRCGMATQREAAFHEAAHVVVARSLRTPVEWAAIGHDGNGAWRGSTRIPSGLNPGPSPETFRMIALGGPTYDEAHIPNHDMWTCVDCASELTAGLGT
jgi:hypothetical protein